MHPVVLYTAAHAHFPDTEPLGGGKAVADYLCREFPDWTVLSPQTLKLDVGRLCESATTADAVADGKRRTRRSASLHEMSEFQYARFCRQFERAATEAILRHDPASCVVLTNDISEGPDFAALGALGYRIVSIWHVDVVEYFTKLYLRDWVRPETAARWGQWRWLPDILKLVFHKQADCVRCSRRIVVPSAPMREMILRCYPQCPAEKIAVVPWGNISTAAANCRPAPSETGEDDRCESVDLASTLIEHRYGDDEFIILTLSRLSPEKGIERLLQALRHLGTFHYRLLICGAPAYMKGRRCERKLRRLARGFPVEFLGHVTGAQKAALLRRADLFVSPSHHESYGLTIAEAEAAGCRIISHGHYGAAGTVVDCGDPAALAAAIRAAAQTPRPQPTFRTSDAAKRINDLLLEVAGAS